MPIPWSENSVIKSLTRTDVADLTAIEKELKELGFRELFLKGRSSNDSAISFYFQVGFTEVGRRISYYRRLLDDALLLKKTILT